MKSKPRFVAQGLSLLTSLMGTREPGAESIMRQDLQRAAICPSFSLAMKTPWKLSISTLAITIT